MGWNSCIKLGNHMRREKGNVCWMIKDDRIYQVLLKYNFDLLICLIIPEILELNDRELIKATYEKGFQLFERMKPYFYTRYSWRENSGFYYRIR